MCNKDSFLARFNDMKKSKTSKWLLGLNNCNVFLSQKFRKRVSCPIFALHIFPGQRPLLFYSCCCIRFTFTIVTIYFFTITSTFTSDCDPPSSFASDYSYSFFPFFQTCFSGNIISVDLLLSINITVTIGGSIPLI